MNDYQKQASDFLNKWGIEIKVKFVDNSCPPFCDGKHIHGKKYKITLIRPINGKKISFNFWNSYNDAQSNKEPDNYSILSCCNSELNCPETFEDFCAEYGYQEDSRKALKTFNLCLKQSKKLNDFFDNEEMVADLGQIN